MAPHMQLTSPRQQSQNQTLVGNTVIPNAIGTIQSPFLYIYICAM